jgi:hypothetical protein
MEVDEQPKLQRPVAALTIHDRFVVTKSSFERQYAQLYFLRLTKMREAVQARAQVKWRATGMALFVLVGQRE